MLSAREGCIAAFWMHATSKGSIPRGSPSSPTRAITLHHCTSRCTAPRHPAAAGLGGLPNHYDYEWPPDAFGAAAALGSAAFGTAPFEAPKEPAAEHRLNLSACAAGRRWSPGRFVRVFSCSVFCTGLEHAETAASMLHLPLPCVSRPRPTTGRPPWPPDCCGRVPRAHTRRSLTDGLQRRLRTKQQTVFGGRKSPPRRSRTMPVCTHCAQRYQRFAGVVGVLGPVPYCDRLRSAECTYSVRVPLRLPPLCVSPRPSVRRALPTACRRGPAPPVAID